MKKLLVFGTGMGMWLGASATRAQDTSPVRAAQPIGITAEKDSVRPKPRPHAIEYSDAYATRLEIHKIGSYVMLPLFATEYYLGDRLMRGEDESDGVKGIHVGVATAIGGLFAVNTVTGVWNLWDSRKDPSGRTKRIVHSVLMLASDAGFATAAAVGSDDDEGGSRTTHRNIALASIGASTVGTVMMWFFK